MAAEGAKKAMTKTQVLTHLSEATGLSKKEVTGFFDEVSKLIASNLAESGPGAISLPGLVKLRVVRKPATPEREGINPFTKEPTTFAAKPARNVVKATPLKALKDLV